MPFCVEVHMQHFWSKVCCVPWLVFIVIPQPSTPTPPWQFGHSRLQFPIWCLLGFWCSCCLNAASVGLQWKVFFNRLGSNVHSFTLELLKGNDELCRCKVCIIDLRVIALFTFSILSQLCTWNFHFVFSLSVFRYRRFSSRFVCLFCRWSMYVE